MVLASLVALGLAAGRPHVERNVPYARTSIILALDVSGSMCSTDVKPNRLTVAQEATREVRRGPAGRHSDGSRRLLGVRRAGGSPDDRARGARSRRSTRSRPAAAPRSARAMLKGLDAIAEVNPAVQPVGDVYALDDDPAPGRPPNGPAPRADDYVPDIIVLLTDGAEHARDRAARRRAPRGRAPRARLHDRLRHDPARRRRRARASSSAAAYSAARLRRRRLRRFGGGFLVADAPTLMAVAEQTGGTYHARRGRRPAARGLRRSPEGRRDAEAADRDHVDARGARRAPRRRSRRRFDPLEPVPLGAGPLSFPQSSRRR